MSDAARAAIDAIAERVAGARRVRVTGGGSKPALAATHDADVVVDATALSGVLEYDPAEFTFTALAGTRVSDVRALLARHGQFLPFDPVLVDAGATLGGTVASGLSGPGRQRYGGVRDFLLGVSFIDGRGRVARGGGRVVKNAAGFDVPKLMTGALGRLGVLTELSFKVFPAPRATATVRAEYPDLASALDAVTRLNRSTLELFALEVLPGPRGAAVLARIGGPPGTLELRAATLRACLGAPGAASVDDDAAWLEAREFTWAAGTTLAKVPVTTASIPALDARLASLGAARRYGAGGHVAWAATDDAAALDAALNALDLGGLAVLGPTGRARLGRWPRGAFLERVERAFDPHDRFAPHP